MIKKQLNCIWLSDNKMNSVSKRCLASWRKAAPDYTIRVWGSSDFDMESMPDWVKEAVSMEKWAFACDYLRLWILYNDGGIYLDSDIFMLKSPDDFMNNRFFTCIEHYPELCPEPDRYYDKEGMPKEEFVPGFGLQAAAFGSEAGHPFLRDCMDFYETHHFLQEDGSYFDKALAPGIQAHVAVNYGFRYKNEEQHLQEGMTIYHGDTVAAGAEHITEGCSMIHLCNGSWRNYSPLFRAKLTMKNLSIIKTEKR